MNINEVLHGQSMDDGMIWDTHSIRVRGYDNHVGRRGLANGTQGRHSLLHSILHLEDWFLPSLNEPESFYP